MLLLLHINMLVEKTYEDRTVYHMESDSRVKDKVEEILIHIKKMGLPVVTTYVVSKHTDFPARTVRRALRVLVEKGKLRREGRRYVVMPSVFWNIGIDNEKIEDSPEDINMMREDMLLR